MKLLLLSLLFIATSLAVYDGKTSEDGARYLFILNKAVRKGMPVQVLGMALSKRDKLSVTAKLIDDTDNTTISQKDIRIVKSDGLKSFELNVPPLTSASSFAVEFSGSGTGSDGNFVFTKRETLDYNPKNMTVFVQTDKEMYKPSQTVKFRVVLLKADMRPFTSSKFTVNIVDPQNNRIKQWLDQDPGNYGVVSLELPLSERPPLGIWKIHVTVGERGDVNAMQAEEDFEVAEYILPKWELNVNSKEQYYIYESLVDRDVSFEVSAKYTHGQVVGGTALVQVQLDQCPNFPYSPYYLRQGYYYDRRTQKNLTITRPTQALSLKIGTGLGEETSPVATFKLNDFIPKDVYFWYQGSFCSINANVTFTETLTGKTKSERVSVKVYQNPYELKFTDLSPDAFRPGYPYEAILQLTRKQGAPLLSSDYPMTVNVTAHFRMQYLKLLNDTTRPQRPWYTLYDYKHTTKNFYTVFSEDDAGFKKVVIPLEEPENLHSLTIQVEIVNVSNSLARKYVRGKYETRSTKSVRVQLVNTDKLKAGDTATFELESMADVDTFYWAVLGREGLLLDGSTRPAPMDSDRRTATQTVAITHAMAPKFRFLLFAIYEGELLADSLSLPAADTLENSIDLQFSVSKVEPGQPLILSVKSAPSSLVNLLAIDQSVLLLKSGNDLSQDKVDVDLMSYLYNLNDWGEYGCWRNQLMWWPWWEFGRNTQDTLKMAQVVAVSDLHLESNISPNIMPVLRRGPKLQTSMIDDMDMDVAAEASSASADPTGNSKLSVDRASAAGPTRKLFPENWIWTSTFTNDNGEITLNLTMPDTITSWIATGFGISPTVGLGLSNEAKVTGFKPFFASMNLPYSVVRGEEFALQVIVFNYLDSDVNTEVILELSTEFEVKYDEKSFKNAQFQSQEVRHRIGVKKMSGKSIGFWIKPTRLGEITLTVTAIANGAVDRLQRRLLVKPEGVERVEASSLIVDMKDQTFIGELELKYPPSSMVVPDSRSIRLFLSGDVMGQAMRNLGSLIRMPYGCGEQNMVNFAPNVYILEYMQARGIVDEELKAKALKYSETGYQRELTYMHDNGGFSAFGEGRSYGGSSTPSSFLSAFVTKTFAQAAKFIFIDPEVVVKTVEWLFTQQQANYSFPETGHTASYLAGGTVNDPITLTAYVLTGLVEVRNNADLKLEVERQVTDFERKLANGFLFLKQELSQRSATFSNYQLALCSYALLLENPSTPSAKFTAAFALLNQRATTEGSKKYWPSPVADEEVRVGDWIPYWKRPKPVNIETAAYALLTYNLQKDVSGGLPIMKWLMGQRNADGGFSSTQDTVVGMQALAGFASLLGGAASPGGVPSGLKVTVANDNNEVIGDFEEITSENKLVVQIRDWKPNNDVDTVRLMVRASAQATNQLGVLQVENKYYVRSDAVVRSINLNANVEDERLNSLKLRGCAAWTETDVNSSMVLMTFQPFSGFTAVQENIKELRQSQNLDNLERVEYDIDKTVAYFKELLDSPSCLTIAYERSASVANAQPANVEAYAYYSPEKASSVQVGSRLSSTSDPCLMTTDLAGCPKLLTNSQILATNGSSSTVSLPIWFFLVRMAMLLNICMLF